MGEAVTKEIQHFFTTGMFKLALNHTFLPLIPKTPSAFKVDQYRPIALCNVVYKLITKIIAGRLRPMLENIVHSSQATFVPKCSIIDNIIIDHEVMFHLKNKKGILCYMEIKVDLAKACDRVEWFVLFHMLHLLRFNDHFIDIITECVATPQFSPWGFPPKRGTGGPYIPSLVYNILKSSLNNFGKSGIR